MCVRNTELERWLRVKKAILFFGVFFLYFVVGMGKSYADVQSVLWKNLFKNGGHSLVGTNVYWKVKVTKLNGENFDGNLSVDGKFNSHFKVRISAINISPLKADQTTITELGTGDIVMVTGQYVGVTTDNRVGIYSSKLIVMDKTSPASFTAGASGGDTVAKKRKKVTGITNPQIKFETTKGNCTVELFSDVPISTKNFVDLASSGFYDGLTFHRYVEGFVVQGGDPTGTGGGGSGKTIPLEITSHKHLKGALGMARSADPNSATSQFYFCLADTPSLDGQYTVFGQVLEGMENVMELRQGDKMTKVTVLKNSSTN
jgi:cyclophilin family peptidyl-prolyl cis-trans isomerase